MRSHDRCGHVWDRWFQEFLTKMAYHPPKFPTERQTEGPNPDRVAAVAALKLGKEPSQRVSADFS